MFRSLWFFAKIGIFFVLCAWVWWVDSFIIIRFKEWELMLHPLGGLIGGGAFWLLWQLLRGLILMPFNFLHKVRHFFNLRLQAHREKYFWYAVESFLTHDFGEAMVHVKKAKGALNDHALVELLKALIACKVKDFETARQSYLTLSKSSNTALLAHFHLGLLEKDKDQLRDRITHLSKASKLGEHPHVLKHLATALMEEKRFGDAESVLNRLVTKDSTASHQLKTQLFLQRAKLCEEVDLKCKFLKKALKISPQNVDVVCQLATILQEEGKNKEALIILENFWRTTPDRRVAHLYFQLCQSYDVVGRVKRAQHLAAWHPDAFETFLLLIRTFLATQLWGEARRVLKLGLSNFPEESQVYSSLAILELKENKNIEAALHALFLLQKKEKV